MVPEQSDDAPAPIRVTDRRRFTEMGDERPSEDGAPPAPRPTEPMAASRGVLTPDAAAAAPPAPTPAPPQAAPHTSPIDGAGADVLAGGIQPVFYILWQSALLA